MTAADPPATPTGPRPTGVTPRPVRPALLALVVVAGSIVGLLVFRSCAPAHTSGTAPPSTAGTGAQPAGTATSAGPPQSVSATATPGTGAPSTATAPAAVVTAATAAPSTTREPGAGTTAATAATAAPTTPTASGNGPTTTVPVPCTPDALTAALAAARVALDGVSLDEPRCTADFAGVVLHASGTLDRFAVFELREPVWALVNVGSSFVCQPLEIPNPDYTDIGCLRWDH